MQIKFLTSLFLLLLFASTVDAQEGGFLKRLRSAGEPAMDSATIESGLREALKVSIERTVERVGREDGYLENPRIRIPLPDTVARFESVLRRFGQGPALDEFVVSMNRAAEAAAPLATEIFAEAIAQMTIQDARAILNGSDSEATDYFRAHATEPLTEAFTPIVEEKMSEFDVVSRYQDVVNGAERVPFIDESIEGNIERYTVEQALEGLFYVLAREERKIRKNPGARSSDLLRKVFGSD